MPRAPQLGPLSPRQFRESLLDYCRNVTTDQLRGVYLDAVSQLDEELALTTRVDTGYLRASRTMAVEGAAPTLALPKRDPHATGQGAWREGTPSQPKGPPAYEAAWAQAEAAGVQALAEAVRDLKPVTVGYLANYAEYVEDRDHMLLAATGKWRVFCERAAKNAGDRGMGRLMYRPGPKGGR